MLTVQAVLFDSVDLKRKAVSHLETECTDPWSQSHRAPPSHLEIFRLSPETLNNIVPGKHESKMSVTKAVEELTLAKTKELKGVREPWQDCESSC